LYYSYCLVLKILMLFNQKSIIIACFTSENGSQTIKYQVLSNVKVISATYSRSETTNERKNRVLFFSCQSYFNIK
jgi:hypothetical protein